MLIDSHVNLHHAQFDTDRAEVIARARAAGIGLMINICDRLANVDAVLALTVEPDIYATVGTHPHEAKDKPDLAADEILTHASRPKVVGIGECGLDYHYMYSPRDVQMAVFRAHIAAARQSGLPLVVHTREADEDCEAILIDEMKRGPFKFLMHCYTSGQRLADIAAEMGAWFSVSGVCTFKTADAVRATIATMPDDRIILETDCPYLAPVPLRGQRCEPSQLPHIAARLAEIKGWSMDTVATRTTDAVYRLFDRIPRR